MFLVPSTPCEVEVRVVGVFEELLQSGDREQRVSLIVLRDPAERELRLPVGSCEGFAIHIALERQLAPRPLTHDLALRLVEKLSAKLDRVVIHRLSNDTPHATMHLQTAGGALALDVGPGDAVAVALRAEAPIYVTEDLLEIDADIP